ncbi:type III secretion system needle filament subunit SctF [Terasakiella pusilla]|jgi:type III secretion protein F|uniref:type III secretion system needle filament subunit SctF n=1 Tax=Terasakiella pusilla TaxID=64973 RepID=UPI00048F6552|nr:type III secretion system needle filament subunit SctF [Terasakiella pusilla]
MSFDMKSMSSNLNSVVTQKANELETLSKNPNGLDDTAHMLEMQQAMQKWSMSINLQSTMMKSYGDAVKSIIQNMR